MVKSILQKIRSIKITKQFWIGLVFGVLTAFLFLFSVLKYDEIVLRPIRSEKYAQQIINSKPTIEPVVTATPLPILLKSSEIKWLDTPQRYERLNVFKSQKEIDVSMSESYGGSPNLSEFYFVKVADLADGSILINAYIPRINFYGVQYIKFVVKEGKSKAILDDVGYNSDYATLLLSPDIVVEKGTIEGLDIPKEINSELGIINNSYPIFQEYTRLQNSQKLTDTQYGSLYVTYTHDVAPSPLYDRIIYLKLKDGLVVRYSLKGYVKYDDNVQKFNLLDGTINQVAFFNSPFWGGCGGGSDASVQVIKPSDFSTIDKEKIGIDSKNNEVYKIIDPKSNILKLAYKQYIDTHSGNNDEVVVSYDDFIKDMNSILIRDNFSDWVFYLNPKYAQLAECGKPVIYLYPEKEQQVNIQVGAKITESEPFYSISGWTVLAKPNGELNYQNKIYPYLFWEGLGNGIYPEVKSRGFMIAKDDIESTLNDHLLKLGLNKNESKDFLEFWLPKMPTTPYTRLTWLMTDEMNQLAPLTVTPKPDTEIRIFLDFEGFDQKVAIIPQKLFAPKRIGFTLVEWGGLLIK